MIQGFSGGLLNRQLIYQTDLPSFQRDFASLKSLNHGTGPNITFTRASDATFFDADGVLQTAGSNVPRFDHDPATGASRGLLLEEARTNNFERSAEFDDAYWGKTRSSISANDAGTTAPDGTNAADKLIANTSNDTHFAARTTSFTSGVAYTATVFAKKAEKQWLAIQFGSTFTGGSAIRTFFNLDNGTTGNSSAGITASIVSIGNGWYRCGITATAGATANAATNFFVTDIDNALAWTGNAADGLYLWGAQLEAGAFATTYIPTTTATVTRAADSAIVTPVSSFYNPAEGTLYAAFRPRTVTGTRTLIAFDNDTEDEQVRLRNVATDPFLTVNNGGVEQANIDAGTVAAETVYGLTGAFKLNDFAASLNGATVVTDTTGTMPTITHLRIGNSKAGNIYNGAIAKLAYWPKRLPDALLEQLTT